MSTATISGTISFPISSGGASSSLILGSPDVTTSSTTGPQLTFTEKSSNSYLITASASPVTISMGTLTDSDILYLGTDAAVTFILNGGAESISLAAGGFALLYGASITALSVSAPALDANIEVLLLGS